MTGWSRIVPRENHFAMQSLSVGIKIYDNDWFLKHRLSAEQAADLLQAMGATWVIAQSRFLPMADSAVDSAVRDRDVDRYRTLDDVAFRRCLKERGIGYFAVLNICFDPAFPAAHTDLVPIDQFGRREELQDWYIGTPPDRAENIGHKIGLLERAAAALEPDGVHLGFIRWPGFWETWLDDVDRAAMPDYCYSATTLSRFAAASGADLPIEDPVVAARIIAARYRAQWRDWKCGVTVAAIRQIRDSVAGARPGVKISINTLPFFPGDFDNVVADVFGQDIDRLREVVDVFEVMAYHQILRKDASWPAAITADIKARAGGQAAVCTLQTRPLYLEGMHAGQGRSPSLDADEFCRAVDAVERGPADGVCVFTFTDLIDRRDTTEGRRMIERLGRFRR
jgi:hypothetical protein